MASPVYDPTKFGSSGGYAKTPLANPINQVLGQAGAAYDPTRTSTTGGWFNAKQNALNAAANAVTSGNLVSQYGTGGYNPLTGIKNELPPISAADTSGGSTPPKNGGTGSPDNGTGTSGKNALDTWTPEGDPLYQQSINSAQGAFNIAKANALFKMNTQQNALTNQILAMDQNSPDANRALADSFAVRGMQRGDYGAYYRAQDKQNAALITAQTDIKDQIASLSQDFLSQYGTTGSDWLGTAQGQAARNQAIQLALQNRLAQAGVNG